MENYENMTLEEIDEQQEEKQMFVIDSAEKADWASEKVIQEQQRLELYKTAVQHRIDKLKEDLLKEEQASEGRTSWLRYKLGEYLHRDDVPAKNTKTQLSLKLPSGTIKFVKPKLDYNKNDETLLEYCKENAKEYIKTKEEVKWGELKKSLEISDGMVLNKDTGEVVDGIEVVETLPKIEVK